MRKNVNAYNAAGDPAQRWYVSYYRDKKLVREYRGINREKDPQRRQDLLSNLLAEVIAELAAEEQNTGDEIRIAGSGIAAYANRCIKTKQKYLKRKAFLATRSHLTAFIAYLVDQRIDQFHPAAIRRDHIAEFQSWLLDRGCANRTINNHMVDVSALFSWIQNTQENVLQKNPCKTIRNLPSISQSHLVYSSKELERMNLVLDAADPYLLTFCRFVAYSFMRPAEIRFLKIGQIDLDAGHIIIRTVTTKVNRTMYRPILRQLRELIISMQLQEYSPEHYVFGVYERPAEKFVSEDVFTRHFRKLKHKMQLSENHSIYGLKHTFVCDLVRSGKPWHEIMKYTGHTTLSSFERYIRQIMALPAADLSDGITMRL